MVEFGDGGTSARFDVKFQHINISVVLVHVLQTVGHILGVLPGNCNKVVKVKVELREELNRKLA